MSIEFQGDVVVITGAGRGLGRAHALLLADRGARVVVNDIGASTAGDETVEDAASVVVREIQENGGIAVADTNNGSTVEGARAIIATAVDSFGRVDAVVANAGILRDKGFHNLSDEDFFAVVDVHLGGTVRMFHAAYPLMKAQGYGRLVATTSAAGLFGNFGQTSYAAAKMGIVGFVRTLALEAARFDIGVNAVAPMAGTRMTEGLLGDFAAQIPPEQVSPLVAYLCHRSADLTGQVVSAGGGRFARVGVGVGAGISLSNLTPESVAEHMGELLEEQDLTFLTQAAEEMQLLAKARQVDG